MGGGFFVLSLTLSQSEKVRERANFRTAILIV